MAFIIHREAFIGEKLERHVNAPHEFVNFEIFVQRQKQFKNLVGVCLFLAWIKSLKYLSFNKTMMQFSTTLSRVIYRYFLKLTQYVYITRNIFSVLEIS